ncbi:hypothetical protein Cs7R123_17750 [Catellatospora sp. TT07R-123]|nr:hypothetical protein Cs7R123_17750 [Catellatospora sp. TT07R-123]
MTAQCRPFGSRTFHTRLRAEATSVAAWARSGSSISGGSMGASPRRPSHRQYCRNAGLSVFAAPAAESSLLLIAVSGHNLRF